MDNEQFPSPDSVGKLANNQSQLNTKIKTQEPQKSRAESRIKENKMEDILQTSESIDEDIILKNSLTESQADKIIEKSNK